MKPFSMCRTVNDVESLQTRKVSRVDRKAQRKDAMLDRKQEENDQQKNWVDERRAELASQGELYDSSTCNFKLFLVVPILLVLFVLFWTAEYRVILFTLQFFPFVEKKYQEWLALALAVMTPVAGDLYLHSIGFTAHDAKHFFRKRLLQVSTFAAFIGGLLSISVLAGFRAAIFVTEMELKYGRVKEYRFLVSVAKFFIPLVIVALSVGAAFAATVVLFEITETLLKYWSSFVLHLRAKHALKKESRIHEKRKYLPVWKQDRMVQINAKAGRRVERIKQNTGRENWVIKWLRGFFYGSGNHGGGDQK